jgi:hypothetical protein
LIQEGYEPKPEGLIAQLKKRVVERAGGERGMAFVEAALGSHADGGGWLDFQPEI